MLGSDLFLSQVAVDCVAAIVRAGVRFYKFLVTVPLRSMHSMLVWRGRDGGRAWYLDRATMQQVLGGAGTYLDENHVLYAVGDCIWTKIGRSETETRSELVDQVRS